MTKEVVLTGLRTNGEYHLGNYIGALMPMIKFATEKSDHYLVNLFAPDLHSFTTPIKYGETFRDQTLDNLKLFVAAGAPLNNASVRIYRQSRISAHSELTWILSNFTGMGELERMTEYKDKRARLTKEIEGKFGNDLAGTIAKVQVSSERISVGLFTYPILMAADILLYGAKWVPVGDDQRQHLEFTRDIAARLNNQFGLDLTVPETLLKQQEFVGRDDAPRIRSLRNPNKKMSKSIDDPAGTILLSDSPDEARKKIMSAETDSVGVINYDWANQPGVTNLLTILANLSGESQSAVNDRWSGQSSYGDLKMAAADATADFLTDLQQRLENVDEGALMKHLESSEALMNEQSQTVLRSIQEAIGLR